MRVQLIRYHDLDNMNTRLAQSLNKRQGVLPPLGLAYIASSLEKAGNTVSIIDAIALTLSEDEVRNLIRDFKPDLIGITAMTPTLRGAITAASIAKEFDVPVVMGGVHMSLYPEETLSFKEIDYGILGEGEDTFVELCEALEKGDNLNDIQGLVYYENDDFKPSSPRLVENLDELPMPSYHLLPMEKYSSIIGLSPVSTMMGSRGCPYKCGFCYKTPSDQKYRTRSPKNIVDEIEFLVKNYGIKEIMFYDDIMPESYAKPLSEEIIRRNVKIQWQTPQRVNLVNKDLLMLMAKAGCHLIRFGVEQGDPDMMKFVEKKTNSEQVVQAFKWAKEAGIDTFAYFIIGYINETEKTMRATIDFAKQLNPRFVMFTMAVPLPNTPLMRLAIEQGFVKEDYWRRFTLGEKVGEIPPLVPQAPLYVKKAYQEYYLRPHIIWSQFLSIKSFSDLKKNVDGFIGISRFKMKEECFSCMEIFRNLWRKENK